ncbi:MAG: DUF4296 domain-containing protein [Bacteroidales bacterium]|nr:DUF4296 domain-containing protein [Bacteroidales bacterium]
MSRFYRIVPILLIVAVSCSKKDIIPRSELPQILADIYMADRSVMNDPLKMSKTDSILIYEPVLKKHGYSTNDLINTFNYYLPTPLKLKSSFMSARVILERRLEEVRREISANQERDSAFAPIRNLIRGADSLKYMDSRERALRWIFAPDLFPNRRIYMPDSLATRYEHPMMLIWWQNNFKIEGKKFYEYEKNRGTISVSNRPEPNPERLSLPEH